MGVHCFAFFSQPRKEGKTQHPYEWEKEKTMLTIYASYLRFYWQLFSSRLMIPKSYSRYLLQRIAVLLVCAGSDEGASDRFSRKLDDTFLLDSRMWKLCSWYGLLSEIRMWSTPVLEEFSQLLYYDSYIWEYGPYSSKTCYFLRVQLAESRTSEPVVRWS